MSEVTDMEQLSFLEYPNARNRKKTPLHDRMVAALSGFKAKDVCKLLWAAQGGQLLEKIKEVIAYREAQKNSLEEIWQQVTEVVKQRENERSVWREGELLDLEQETATVGCKLQPLLESMGAKITHLEEAFEQVLGKRIRVTLECIDQQEYTELESLWVRATQHMSGASSRAIMGRNGHLVSLDNGLAVVGIDSAGLFRFAESHEQDIRNALEVTLGRPIQLELICIDISPGASTEYFWNKLIEHVNPIATRVLFQEHCVVVTSEENRLLIGITENSYEQKIRERKSNLEDAHLKAFGKHKEVIFSTRPDTVPPPIRSSPEELPEKATSPNPEDALGNLQLVDPLQPKLIKRIIEKPVKQGKRTIGSIDAYFELDGVLSNTLKVVVEVKTEIQDLGELIRQIQKYKEGTGYLSIFVVVCPHFERHEVYALHNMGVSTFSAMDQIVATLPTAGLCKACTYPDCPLRGSDRQVSQCFDFTVES